MTHVDHQTTVDDPDDDFTPPVAVRVETRLENCPVCGRPLKKHNTIELMECSSESEADEDDDENPCNRPGDWFMIQTQIGHEAKVMQIFEARKDVRIYEIDEKHKLFPGYVLVRCDLSDDLWRTVRSTPGVSGVVGTNGSRPLPLSRRDVEAFLFAEESHQAPPTPEPPPEKPKVNNFETFKAKGLPRTTRPAAPVEAPPAPTEDDVQDAWTSSIPFPTDDQGDVDYEKLVPLAAAMRTVLERERDEIIRRGGPIEKQNIELKERLGKAIEDLNMWRRKAQVNAESRNSLQAQVDAQTKTIRLLRNELKGRKETNHVHLNEINDILAVVDKTRGWTREMGGTGHWQIYKAGVWISDAAGSGGSTRVNQATRVKLRKAGLEV